MKRWVPPTNDSTQAYTFTRRAMVLGGAQIGVAALLAGRMAWLSIAENEHYKLLSESNRVQMQLIPPRRGWIVDRQGQPLAINRSDFRVDLIPDQLKDPGRIIGELTQLLELPPSEVDRIREDLGHAAGYQPVAVAENLSFDKYAAVTVRLPELPGVSPLRAFSRYYPEGAAVGHLVGYVGVPNKEEYEAENKAPLLVTPGFKIGKQGLEQTMEQKLRGRPGAKRVEVTARGKLVRELATLGDRAGPVLPLTIDAGLQTYAARRIGDQSAAVVVIDCHNGDILAMASMPAFDPNSFSDGISHMEWDMLAQDERHPLINKVLQGLYPPGSTSKPMNALALLQAGIDPNTKVNCQRAYRVGNAVFHCDKAHGPLAMHDAISKSCDIYFYHMSRQAGIGALAPMMRNMGLGQKFELPFHSQRFGTVPDPDWLRKREHREWAEYDTINISIGQGYLLVNPMQQAVMMARLASGRSLHPRLLRSQPAVAAAPLPVTPEHLAFVRDAMDAVVNGGGTAGGAKLQISNVRMGGKTGTAQVRRISMAERYGGGVRSNESLAWKMRDHSHFIGFAPVEAPRYAVAAIVEHGGWGASAAAPLVRDVMTYLFDKDKAMEVLLPMEKGWGGTIAERMDRDQRQWFAAHPERQTQQAAASPAPPPASKT